MGGLSRSITILLLPILTRLFSPDEYGIIDIIATMTGLLALLMTLSLESAIARFWFESIHNSRQKQLLSTIIASNFVFGACVFAVIWHQSTRIATLLLGNPLFGTYVVLGALGALLMALSRIPQIVLRMERRIVFYNLLTMTQAVSYMTFALLLIFQFDTGLLGVFVAQVLAAGLALIVGLLWISAHLSFSFSFPYLRSSLRYSLPVLPAVAVTWANNQIDRIILLGFLGLGMVGIYGAAARIVTIIGLLVTIFEQAWTPLAIAFIDNESGRNEFYRRILNYYAGAMAAIALVVAAFCRELLAIFVPAEYQSGYVVIPWLIGALILQGSGSITNIGTLISKRTFGNSIAAWTGAAVNAGLGLLLIPHIGIWGAALGSFLAAAIFTGMLWRFSVRLAEVRFDTRNVLCILGCYVVTCSAIIAAYEFIGDPVQSLVIRLLLLTAALSVIVFLTVDVSIVRTLRAVIDLKV